MPFSDPVLRFRHILTSIAYIEDFIAGMDLATFQRDYKTRFAVERQMQVLTEAAFRLGDQAPVLCPEIDWRGVRGMGNRLRYGYDHIIDTVIWDAVRFDLPPMKRAVAAALERLPGAADKP